MGRSPWLTPKHVRWMLLALVALLPLLTPLVAPHHDALFMYPYAAGLNLLSSGFCVVAGRKHLEERSRWNAVALAQVMQAVLFVIAVLHVAHRLSDRVDFVGRGLLSAGSNILLLAALMLARVRSGFLVRSLDIAQMVLACMLMAWALMAGELVPGRPHVYLNWTAHAFIVCVALTALFSGDTAGLRQFSRAVVGFLIAGLVTRLIVNVVFYAWLQREWALPVDVVFAAQTILLCEWSMAPADGRIRSYAGRLDRSIVDSMQPTWLMLGSTLLGLFTLDRYPVLAALLVLLAVSVYALRTQAFYYRLYRERTQLRSEASLLHQLATIDALTGVGNRRWFEQHAMALLADEGESRFALLLVDADHFKEINDSFGHFVGDEMLRHVAAAVLDETVRLPRACCARLGGDEFAALIAGLSMEEALEVAISAGAQVRAAKELVALAGPGSKNAMLQPTVSIGLAWVENKRLSLGLLMRWADAALYQAKDAGRDCVRSLDLTVVADVGDLSVLEALPRTGRERPAPAFPKVSPG